MPVPPSSPRPRPRGVGQGWYGVTGRALVALASLGCLVLSGLAWVTYRQLVSGLRTSTALDVLPKTTPKSTHGDMNILLIGLDSRRDMNGNPLPPSVIENDLHAGDGTDLGGYNTNTLILLHVPGNGAKATAISIPRDDYVAVPGYGMQKIKEAYGLAKADADTKLYHEGVPEPRREQEARDAGRRSTLLTVENLLHVPIDHFAEVNLIGFYDVVSAIGPIQVCLNGPVFDTYSGANFHAGLQTINAAQALEFVRQRHGLPYGDLDRTHRQQAFIAGVSHKLRTSGVFSDLSHLQALINVAKKDVVIDNKLDPLKLAAEASNLTSGNITFYTLPIEGFATRNGEDVNIVDPAKLQAEVHALLSPTPKPAARPSSAAPKPATHAVVDVYNGSGENGIAGATSAELVKQGYTAGTVGNTDPLPHTTVSYGSGAQADAQALAGQFHTTATADPSLPAGHVRIDLGADAPTPSTPGSPSAPSNAVPTSGAQGPPIHSVGGIPCVN